jgi:hypothetical protein
MFSAARRVDWLRGSTGRPSLWASGEADELARVRCQSSAQSRAAHSRKNDETRLGGGLREVPLRHQQSLCERRAHSFRGDVEATERKVEANRRTIGFDGSNAATLPEPASSILMLGELEDGVERSTGRPPGQMVATARLVLAQLEGGPHGAERHRKVNASLVTAPLPVVELERVPTDGRSRS